VSSEYVLSEPDPCPKFVQLQIQVSNNSLNYLRPDQDCLIFPALCEPKFSLTAVGLPKVVTKAQMRPEGREQGAGGREGFDCRMMKREDRVCRRQASASS
jgi:hypothetical protein